MPKAALSSPRTAPDVRARRAANDPDAPQRGYAGKPANDAKRHNGTVASIIAAFHGGPRDARIHFPERRWRESPFVLVERRKGPRWKYGSIVICAVLWAYVWWLFHR